MKILIAIATVVIVGGVCFRLAAFYRSSKNHGKTRLDEVKHGISANLD